MQKAGNFDYLHRTNLAEEEEAEDYKTGRDTTKVYFFIIAIVALLATNIYFYLRYQSSELAIQGINTEKVEMRDEIDRIEAEVNRLSLENTDLSTSLQASRDSLRLLIADLRVRLSQQTITHAELEQTQAELDKLRAEVIKYKDEMSSLKAQNARLLAERQKLENSVAAHQTQVTQLEEENTVLQDQLKSAAALKLSNMRIVGIRERSRNREQVEDKAKRIDKFQVSFSLVDNPLVPIGETDIYMRVIDPSGNLRTSSNLTFALQGNPMQYTEKHRIHFTNQGETYHLEWVDPQGFKKGTYTILLYTENSTMGKNSIVLN